MSQRGWWAGGRVKPNIPTLVGEKGAEIFRSAFGDVFVGLGGKEVVNFTVPGTVIPAHKVEAEERARERALALPRRSQSASTTGSGPRTRTAEPERVVFESTYAIEVNGTNDPQMEAKLRAMFFRIEQERKARYINWRGDR